MKISYVNTIIFNEDLTQIAYLKKLAGPKFLIGKYNFIGGKVDKGETTSQAAIREVKEEAFISLQADKLVSVCIIDEYEWKLETFFISISNDLFAQIKQNDFEPVYTGQLKTIREDAIYNPSLYSPDFLFFLEKTISLLHIPLL